MQRIICHWSEGNYRANDVDLKAYHILIEGDGTVRFGRFSIADNVDISDGCYAAHTLHCNTGSIGVSCCSMVGCKESPFEPGPQPLNEKQWETLSSVAADLCEFYNIAVTPKTLLGHGEVQDNLGIRQRGKWDPLVLPWDPTTFDLSKTRRAVGDLLRAQITAKLGNAAAAKPALLSVGAVALLRSPLFAGNADLEAIAAGHRVLRTGGQVVAGVGVLQDALNQLADAGVGDYRIDLGLTSRFRGYFGEQTERAVIAFQRDNGLREDGVVGSSTIRAVDQQLVRLEQARPAATLSVAAPAIPTARTVTPSGYAPPLASARLLAGLDFSTVNEQIGQNLLEAYVAADRDHYCGDPSNCKALLQFNDGTVYYDAKMAICADGSPR
ncbi:MAG TPA: peptidoglycan-binding domain-containing protein, partial [Chthoniobacterales bacterium]